MIQATAAPRAGIKIKELFAGQFLDLGGPEGLGRLKIPDGGQLPLGYQGTHVDIGRAGYDMKHARIGDEGDKSKDQK